MCGIVGIVNMGGALDPQEVWDGVRLLQHRGPDHQDVYVNNDIGFGHARLSILDISEDGHQPMHSSCGRYVMVYNGEIYNFRELRRAHLSSHAFRGASDSEVLIELYSRLGPSCIEHLRGMFAFAIWDKKEKRLFLARDRVGQKPLYIRRSGDTLIFASEVRALRAFKQFDWEVAPQAVWHYLTYQYIPSPMSIYQGVEKLAPATTMTFEKGEVKQSKYWQLDYRDKLEVSEEEAQEMFREQVKEATQIRLISDVALGAFLSGGLDSSTVVAAMAQSLGDPVKTFTIDFPEDGYSEAAWAKKVANRYQTDYRSEVVNYDAIHIIPWLTWHYGEPFADSSAIPTWHVARLARREVTVVLNGDGGDEGFGGYPRYVLGPLLHKLYRLPAKIRRRVMPDLYKLFPADKRLIWRAHAMLREHATPPEHAYMEKIAYFTDDAKRSLCGQDFLEHAGAKPSQALLNEVFDTALAGNLTDGLLSVDTRTYLPDDLMTKVDVATMAEGLEARSPLLDHKLLEFAASLPHDFKVRGKETKWLMKEATAPWLERDIRYRPKMGFGVPIDSWFRGPLSEYLGDTLLSQAALGRGYFKPEALRRLVDEHTSGKSDHRYRLYALLTLEQWHRMFMDDSSLEKPTRPS